MREKRMTPDEKFLHDPVFNRLVTMLRASIRQYDYTPNELREAVMLACTMHEMETVRPILYGKTTWYPVAPKDL